jgi:small subunit ribosomal protein S21
MRRQKKQKSFGLTVIVDDGKFEKAMRLFKKKCEEAGIVKEYRDRMEYVKPTTKRKMMKNAARKRWLKHLESSKLPEKNY